MAPGTLDRRRRGGGAAQRAVPTAAATAAALLLLLCLEPANAAKLEEREFIGWHGDTYKPQREFENPTDEVPAPKKQWVQTLSWRPRAFVYHNFLSDAEAMHIIKLAAPQLKRSTVVGSKQEGVVDSIRTSAGTFLMRNQDKVLTTVAQRLALWSGLPPSHQEDMQVLRYGPTNKYGAHLDGLGRVATVLIYLVEPEEGGETAFAQTDESHWLHPEAGEATQGPFSQCAKGKVAYKPKRGDALLFWDRKPNGQSEDPYSMHTGCPVIRGIKWNAVLWLHPTPFREADYNRSLVEHHEPLPDPGMCTDLHELCGRWAKSGECEKNAGYMLGSSTGQGMCRRSCKDCEVCQPKDKACVARNRDKGGYLTFDEAELKLAEMGVAPGQLNF